MMSMLNSQQDALVTGSDARPPILYRGNYVQWFSREIFDPNNTGKMKMQAEEDLSTNELSQYESDIKLKNILLYGLRNDIYISIDSQQKESWNALKRTQQGADVGVQTQ
ncbi:hypothetical protein Tco_1101829 [Tanacetum coccineum]